MRESHITVRLVSTGSGLSNCAGLDNAPSPPKDTPKAQRPGTSESDFIWEGGLCRCNEGSQRGIIPDFGGP